MSFKRCLCFQWASITTMPTMPTMPNRLYRHRFLLTPLDLCDLPTMPTILFFFQLKEKKWKGHQTAFKGTGSIVGIVVRIGKGLRLSGFGYDDSPFPIVGLSSQLTQNSEPSARSAFLRGGEP